VYSFDKPKEYQVTSLNGMAHSPVFVDDNKILFIFNNNEVRGIQFSINDDNGYAFEEPFVVGGFITNSV
jgi:hypothetical protein